MDADALLKRLREAPVQHLPLGVIQTDEAFQPRDLRMISYRHKGGVEGRSEEMIGRMRLHLEATQTAALDAVLVADIAGVLFVVDGHHRLKAYHLAARDTIPARVSCIDRKEAVLASKLANCSERALPMHGEQCRDAAWQYLAILTRRGSRPLPKGESLRTVAGRFGIAKDTVSRMLKRLRTVEADWREEARDPGTDFVRWRYVRESTSNWKDMKEQMTAEQFTNHRMDRTMKKIGTLIEGEAPEVRRLIWQQLVCEAKEELGNDPDVKAFIAETADPIDLHSDF